MVLGWHGVLQRVARPLRIMRRMKILGVDCNTMPLYKSYVAAV